MAKRRKEKDEDEEFDFKIPKFDEEKYLKKEKRNIKANLISFIFGIIMAVVCFFFWTLLKDSGGIRWPLIFLLGMIYIPCLKYLFIKLKIDLTDFGKKGWILSGGVYIFTWLLVLIILVNPPIYDDEAPYIEAVTLPGMQEIGGTVKIVAKIVDNAQVENIQFSIDGVIIPDTDYTYENNIFIYEYPSPANLTQDSETHNYTIVAKDSSNLEKNTTGIFEYNNDALSITSSRFTGIMSGDSIAIKADEKISDNNFRVYYRIDGGSEINCNRKDVDDKEKYITSAECQGWVENTNLTVNIYVETSHYFESMFEKFSNIVKDSATYNFSTGDDPNIGTETPPATWNWTKTADNQASDLLNYDTYNADNDGNINNDVLLPYPTTVQVPGFELAIFMISLIAVVLIFKYKKKDKHR